MKLSDLPSETFPIPFANAAGGGFINQIPEASQIGITNGAASLTDGFPPLNFLPVGSGGVPPFGQDMNGILNQITQWTRWQNAGGLTEFDSALSTAIGGYPQGAMVAGTAAGVVYLNTVDDNTTNPNSGGANWLTLATAQGVQNSQYIWAGTFGGSANALTATLTPVPTALAAGMVVTGLVPTTNTSATVTLNVNSLGAATVQRRNATVLGVGDIKAGINQFIFDGTVWKLANPGFGPSTVAANGYIDLPGGLTMQWGTGSTTTGVGNVTFSKAFSAAPYSMVAVDNGATGWSTSNASFLGVANLSSAGATMRSVTWNGTTFISTTTSFAYLVVGPT